jgi:prolyl-tRNA editing enzyme YbaK/EbsC (Cys-tRNA(Pro) deacylase)
MGRMPEAHIIQPTPQHPNVTAVQQRLEASGVPAEVLLLDEGVHTAAAAAYALSVEVGQIANSLIFEADGEPLLVLTSGAHRVDTAKLAAALGVAKLKRATPEFVREHTGQPIGGVAPIGHPHPVRTLLDVALRRYDVIWAAGGVPQAVFPIGYDDLLSITKATEMEVA